MKQHGANPYQMARLHAGFTQEQAVSRLHIAVRTLQGYESGSQSPSPQMVAMMTRLYGIQLGLSDNPAAASMNLLKQLDDVIGLRGRIQEITRDGVIWPDEKNDWMEILKETTELGAACLTMTQVPVYDIPHSMAGG